MTRQPEAPAASPARILVLGRSQNAIDTVLHGLAQLGHAAQGSSRPEQAAADFDPAAFDLVAIGGSVDGATRAAVKQAFAARHPSIRLVDVQAPVAVRQILAALAGTEAAPAVDLDRYFARVGYRGPRTADLATLKALHELQPATIPFEGIGALLGRGIDLAPAAVDGKLLGTTRGGYCFEQNGLFQRVLTTLGYPVTPMMGRVLWNMPPGARPQPRTHQVLRTELDGVPWLVDVGFGSVVPTEPLRLDTEEAQETRHETFRVIPFGTELLLQARRDGVWLSVYQISQDAVQDADLEAANWFTSTHPESNFRRNLLVTRVTPEARHTLFNSRYTVRRPGRAGGPGSGS
jgi:N-hydroxyarylamine O-acetyltransferase